MKQIEICDVTLRDGAQGEGISFSAGDKLGIITVLSRLGIGMIEAGRFNPSLALCVAICRVLGKTLNDLFWEEESTHEAG